VHIELQCPHCGCDFVHEPEFPLSCDPELTEKEVVWDTLGDGGTIEDSLHAALSAAGAIYCPDCDAPVPVDEEALGRLAMSMLTCW